MATAVQHHEKLRASWIWLALFGLIALIGGIMALIDPFAASLAATVLAGWVFVAMGVLQIIQSFQVRGWAGFAWYLLLGLLALLVGLSLVFNPLEGMISITIVIGILFLVTGVVKTMYAFSLRPMAGWGWVLFSGLVSVVLAIMIFAGFPATAASVPGILLGIELVSNGLLFLFVAFGLRRLTA